MNSGMVSIQTSFSFSKLYRALDGAKFHFWVSPHANPHLRGQFFSLIHFPLSPSQDNSEFKTSEYSLSLFPESMAHLDSYEFNWNYINVQFLTFFVTEIYFTILHFIFRLPVFNNIKQPVTFRHNYQLLKNRKGYLVLIKEYILYGLVKYKVWKQLFLYSRLNIFIFIFPFQENLNLKTQRR